MIVLYIAYVYSIIESYCVLTILDRECDSLKYFTPSM